MLKNNRGDHLTANKTISVGYLIAIYCMQTNHIKVV